MRILFLAHFIPHPPTGGASLRNYNIVKELAKTNDVHLVTFSQRDRHPTRERIEQSRRVLAEFCREVTIVDVPTDYSRLKWYALLAFNTFSAAPYSAWRFWSKEMVAALNRTLERHQFDVVHVDTIALAGYHQYLRGLPAVLNHHNVESSLLLRRSAIEKSPAARWYVRQQGNKLRAAEIAALTTYDGNIAVSELDRQELLSYAPGARVVEIPNGTDTEFFHPDETTPPTTSLVFAGSMAWYPNSDAMILFGEKIWPLIKAEVPEVVMNLIGSRAPEAVLRLAENDPQFRTLGFVDDVRPTIAAAAVYVVPIRVGGGTRLKILDAMAMGKAIVSHPIGAEGLDVRDGHDIVIAEAPEEFARRVIDLIRDPERRKQLATNARQSVMKKYAWGIIVPRLVEFYREVAARDARRG